MRKFLPLIIILLAASCATTQQPSNQLSSKERESMLLFEMDRTKKQDKARLDRMVARSQVRGDEALARQEEEARHRSIQLYRALLERFPENRNDIMAEASFRLAELLFENERERIRFILETEGEEADLVPDFADAIKAYRAVIERFPAHPLTEDALYGLSYCYTEQGDPDSAADGYTELIAKFPGTRYAIEINMRLGEYNFTMENLQEAIVHYKYVISNGAPDYVEKALYKLGWCYYNLDDYKTAIDKFFTLLDQNIEFGRSPESLVDESIDIIARSFSESGGTPSLVKTFSRRGYNEYSPTIMLKLADLYKERSLYPEAIGTYRTYLERFPAGKQVPEALENMRESYFIRADTLEALGISETLVENIGPGTQWYVKSTPDRQDEAMFRIYDGLEAAAGRRRARSQAAGKINELNIALNNLELYESLAVENTPCRISHLKSLVLAELGQFPESPLAYNQLAVSDKCTDWAERASLESVAFQIQVYENEKKYDLPLFEKSVGILEMYAPDNPSAPKALLALGEITLNTDDTAAARNHFSRIIRKYPGSDQSDRARLLVARTFFKENNFKQAATWFKESWKKNSESEERAEARKLHVYSLFKHAEKLSDSNQIAESADRFKSIYDHFPESDVAQVSLYNSGKLFRSIGLERRATTLFEELASAYRESDLASEALQMSVLILEALGDPIRAADDSMALAEISDGHERASALLKAADLYSKGQDHSKAAASRKVYTNEFREPLVEYARQMYLLGKDFEVNGDWSEASGVFRNVVAFQKKHDTNVEISGYAARSQLSIAEESYERYNSMKIIPPVEESVVNKRDLLQEVIRNFVAAGTYKMADVITASNFFIGRSLELFKEDILNSPRPEDLSEIELEEYNLLLDEMAYPFEEKALNAYKTNIQRAVKLEILDPWIEKSFERMAQLAPWAYEREEAYSYPSTLIYPPPLSLPSSTEKGSASSNSLTKQHGGVI